MLLLTKAHISVIFFPQVILRVTVLQMEMRVRYRILYFNCFKSNNKISVLFLHNILG